MVAFHSVKIDDDLPKTVRDWILKVLAGKVKERQCTFSTALVNSKETKTLNSELVCVINETLAQTQEIQNRCQAFFNDTFSKIDFVKTKTKQIEWPVIFKIRWERIDNSMHWAFYINTDTRNLEFRSLTKEILVQYDEIDDELEVFSLPFYFSKIKKK